MFGVVGRSLYGDVDEEHFGTLWQSLFTCFVLLTLDDWFDVYTNIIRVDPSELSCTISLCIIIDREAGEIIRLVASVRPSVDALTIDPIDLDF